MAGRILSPFRARLCPQTAAFLRGMAASGWKYPANLEFAWRLRILLLSEQNSPDSFQSAELLVRALGSNRFAFG